ncbi:MAG: ribonuclease E inhibitor RraB [Thalassotalea sp.]
MSTVIYPIEVKMERNLALFPEDENGNTLWQMLLEGDDLSDVREVEFSVLFPSQELALQFGHLLLENNQKLSFCSFPGDTDYPWEITAYPEMEASYENVVAYQHLLESSSAPLKGKFDGWYCVTASKLPY